MAVTHTNTDTTTAASSSVTLSSVDATGTDVLLVAIVATRGSATVTATFNGSENFAEDQRFGVFPAVSAGLVVS